MMNGEEEKRREEREGEESVDVCANAFTIVSLIGKISPISQRSSAIANLNV